MSSSSTPSPPPNASQDGPQEPSVLLFLENASFAGNIMGAICYGVVLTLFFQCILAIVGRRNKQKAGMKNIMLAYVIFMFAMGTVFTAMNLNLQQRSYIAFRNYPAGGPLGYSLEQYSHWRAIIPNACFIITNWFADGLLMYRCYVIYNKNRWILILPIILFCGSFSMGTITLFKSSQPGSNLWSGITVNFGLPYFTTSVALNVLLTFLISFKLIQHNQMLVEATSTTTNLYKNVVTMLVESCALYALFSILFIGTYAAGNYASDLFLPILSQVQIISPYLIILRVATQRSVTGNRTYSSKSGNIITGSFHAASDPSNNITNGTNNTPIAMNSLHNDSFESEANTRKAAYDCV